MLINNGNTEGLFRAAFMQSGAPLPSGDITDGQSTFNTLVENTGCSKAKDALACMRGVSSETMQAAVDKSPNYYSFSVSCSLD